MNLNYGDNRVVLTLYEKSTQLNPFYTFKMVRKGTFEEIVFTSENNSPVKWYWDSFTISVVDNNNVGLTAGKVNMYSGEWNYTVYEMANNNDLDLNNALGVVEQGLVVVTGTYSYQVDQYNVGLNATASYYKII